MKDVCWLGYKITKTNNKVNITLHHLDKKENGGELVKDNIALLTDTAHNYLHLIEYKDRPIYEALNEILKIVNKQGYSPTYEQYRIINCLLEMFEEKHINDKNSKGKTLIKHKYLEREIKKWKQ